MTTNARLRAITEHKSWVIVSGLLGMLITVGFSVLGDLAAGNPVGSTIIANLEHPKPLPVVTSSLLLVGWFWMIFTAYRHKRQEKNDDQ